MSNSLPSEAELNSNSAPEHAASRIQGELGQANSQPQGLSNIWKGINYPSPKPQEVCNSPMFSLASGEQEGQVPRGLRLDVMNIQQGFRFFKTNSIRARLYRANGEIIEPTAEGKKLLNSPVSSSWAAVLPDGGYAPQVVTYFPWGTEALEEAWIGVTIGLERYWLEIPYGFDRNPAAPSAPSTREGPPQYISAMKVLTEHDHVVRWQNVQYDLGRTQDGRQLWLFQSNPFDAQSEVELYRFPETQDLYSPHTGVRLVDGDGTAVNGRCVNLHLDDNHLRRTDTFDIHRQGAHGLRCWGQIEVSVDGRVYRVMMPSSLYRYVHGHAWKPSAIDFLSTLRAGMTLGETEQVLKHHNGTRELGASSKGHRQYHCVFTPNAGEYYSVKC